MTNLQSLFALSAEVAMVTAAIVPIDGGWSAW
jgi:hypothetical protein